MKTTSLVIISVFLFNFVSNGQNAQIDSLEALLAKHTRTDKAKVDLLNDIAYKSIPYDIEKAKSYIEMAREIALQLDYPEGESISQWTIGQVTRKQHGWRKALGCIEQALETAKRIDYKEGAYKCLISIGTAHRTLGDYDASIEAFEQALQITKELKNNEKTALAHLQIAINMKFNGNPIGAVQQIQEALVIAEEIGNKYMIVNIYSQLADIYQMQGNAPAALEYYLKALRLNEKTDNYRWIISNLTNISDIQASQNDFDSAFETLGKALDIATQKQDSTWMLTCYTNIGNLYKQISDPKALDYYQMAILCSKHYEIVKKAIILTNIGAIYTSRKEFDKASENLTEAVELIQDTNATKELSEVYVQLGVFNFVQQKYTDAKAYMLKALGIAIRMQYAEIRKNCYLHLSEIYAVMGDYRNAYTNHTQLMQLSDSLSNETDTRKIALLESSYKFAKEREIYELERTGRILQIKNQKRTILSLVVISLLVALLAAAGYWSGRLKKKVLRLEIENMNQEIEANQKAMAMATLKLVQNSKRDAQTVCMLENIGKNTTGKDAQNIGSLINNYKLQTNHSNWDEFETLFTKVNSAFWEKLNALCPTLTPNERKLCVFLKLNMSNKDIMLITLQTEEALKKSRLRLRQKLNLDRGVNLSAFIQNL